MRYFNTLLFLAVMPLWAFAQTTIFDFEGTPPTFNDFNGSFTQVIDNPDASGLNASAKVAENTVPAGATFAGVNIPDQSISLSEDKGFTMQVWSPMTNVPVLLKLEGGDEAERQALFTGNPGEWQELTFDFSGEGDLQFTSVTVFMNFDVVVDEEMVFYWDNLQQIFIAPPSEPMTAAPTPDEDPEDVISLYSDAYDDVPVDTWLTPWSAAQQEEIEIEGNPTRRYSGLDFAGVEHLGPNALNLEAAGMTHMHIDLWTPNIDTFRIRLVDFGMDGFGGDNDTQADYDFEPAQSGWVSLDIPLEDFAGMNLSDVSQMIFAGIPAPGDNVVFVDNIYYFKQETLTGEQMDLPVTFDDPDVAYSTVDFAGAVSEFVTDPTEPANTVVQTTKLAGAEIFAGTTLTEDLGGTPNDPGFASPIPFAPDSSIITVRVWSPAADVPVRLKVESSTDAAVSVETETRTTVAMEWETLEFEFKNNVGGTAPINYDADYNKLTIFFDFGTMPDADATYFWDDVEFPGTTTPDDEEPMEPAPTPDVDPQFVISMFSDAYNNVPVDTWLTSWSAANLEDIEIQGNATKLYTGLDFAGIETVGPNALNLEAAEMTHLHVDVWTPNSTTFRIKLVDFGMDGFGGGNDTEFEIPFEGLAQGEWVSLDIPLADFEGMNLSDVSQFIISSLPTGTSTVYLDNVYYYNADPNSTSSPQLGVLSAFPNPAAGHFTIRAPKVMDALTLYDAAGRVVAQYVPGTEQFRMDTSSLEPGVYVAVAAAGAQRWVVKVIRE